MSYWLDPTFQPGDRVKIIRQKKYQGEKLIGLIGSVRSESGSNVAVVLDTVTNTRSMYGAFYFKANELVQVDEFNNEIAEENNMSKKVTITNYLNIARVQLANVSIVGVYDYANFDPELAKGDLCVVSSETGALMLATVTDIVDEHDKETYREVVAKVNTEAWDARVKQREQLAELKAKMQERAKKLQDIMLYQVLAKDDADMAALLKEYQTLSEQ